MDGIVNLIFMKIGLAYRCIHGAVYGSTQKQHTARKSAVCQQSSVRHRTTYGRFQESVWLGLSYANGWGGAVDPSPPCFMNTSHKCSIIKSYISRDSFLYWRIFFYVGLWGFSISSTTTKDTFCCVWFFTLLSNTTLFYWTGFIRWKQNALNVFEWALQYLEYKQNVG